jgi:hypothetical protein
VVLNCLEADIPLGVAIILALSLAGASSLEHQFLPQQLHDIGIDVGCVQSFLEEG